MITSFFLNNKAVLYFFFFKSCTKSKNVLHYTYANQTVITLRYNKKRSIHYGNDIQRVNQEKDNRIRCWL